MRARCWVAYLFMHERDALSYEIPRGPGHAERMAAATQALDAINADLDKRPPTDEEWCEHVRALLGEEPLG